MPVLYLIYTFFASVSSYPFGKLADKIGRQTVMLLALLFWALVCLDILFFKSYWLMILVFVLYGMHKGALEPVQSTLVSELAPEQFRASCIGTYQMVIGLCAFPASLIAGLLWDKINLLAPFYLSLGLTIMAGILMLFVKEPKSRSN